MIILLFSKPRRGTVFKLDISIKLIIYEHKDNEVAYNTIVTSNIDHYMTKCYCLLRKGLCFRMIKSFVPIQTILNQRPLRGILT